MSAEVLEGCAGDSCCTPYCDLGEPSCEGGASCQPFFPEGFGPPVNEERGLCANLDACPDGCVAFVENATLDYAI